MLPKIISRPKSSLCRQKYLFYNYYYNNSLQNLLCPPKLLLCHQKSLLCRTKKLLCCTKSLLCHSKPLLCHPKIFAILPKIVTLSPAYINQIPFPPMQYGSPLPANHLALIPNHFPMTLPSLSHHY